MNPLTWEEVCGKGDREFLKKHGTWVKASQKSTPKLRIFRLKMIKFHTTPGILQCFGETHGKTAGSFQALENRSTPRPHQLGGWMWDFREELQGFSRGIRGMWWVMREGEASGVPLSPEPGAEGQGEIKGTEGETMAPKGGREWPQKGREWPQKGEKMTPKGQRKWPQKRGENGPKRGEKIAPKGRRKWPPGVEKMAQRAWVLFWGVLSRRFFHWTHHYQSQIP